MAISTYKTFLMKGTTASSSTTWAKLVDIKDFSDLGGTPEMIDVTTLSNGVRVNVPGVEEMEALTFTCNYDQTDYETLEALVDTETDFAVWFGGTESGGVVTPTGSNGKFEFTGKLTVYVNGGGVNEPVNMTVSIACSTAPVLAD